MENTYEKWLPVVGHPNYEVSSNGNVRSITHKTFQNTKDGYRFNTYKGKNLVPKICNSGYYRVMIDGRLKTVHRIVAEAFIENTFNKRCVNHIDGNKLNNNVSNLEWCSDSENHVHAWKLGLQHNSEKTLKALENGRILCKKYNKSRQKQILCIETGELFENTRDCSSKMNIDRHTLMRHVNNTPIIRKYVQKDGTISSYTLYVTHVKGMHYKYAS